MTAQFYFGLVLGAPVGFLVGWLVGRFAGQHVGAAAVADRSLKVVEAADKTADAARTEIDNDVRKDLEHNATQSAKDLQDELNERYEPSDDIGVPGVSVRPDFTVGDAGAGKPTK